MQRKNKNKLVSFKKDVACLETDYYKDVGFIMSVSIDISAVLVEAFYYHLNFLVKNNHRYQNT